MSSLPRETLARDLMPAVLEAGRAIMAHFTAGTQVSQKSDGSPVTAADEDAEAILLRALHAIAPQIAVVAEESASAGRIPAAADTFFLVDPLDGTREFTSGRPEFTINIALVEHGEPVFGLIYAPAMSKLYWTQGAGEAFMATIAPGAPAPNSLQGTPLACRKPGEALTIVASRSHGSDDLEDWLHGIAVAGRANIGSSLKFCLLAQGTADLYPRFGPTMEWDTAAGHAIAQAAGAHVTGTQGEAFLYGKTASGYRNPGFIVWGCAALARSILQSKRGGTLEG